MRLILIALSLFGAVTATAQPEANVDAGTLVGTWVGSHGGATGRFNTAELQITRVEGQQVFGVYKLEFRQSQTLTGLQRYYNNDFKCTGIVEGNSLYLKTELGIANVRLNISSTDGKLTMAGQVEGQDADEAVGTNRAAMPGRRTACVRVL